MLVKDLAIGLQETLRLRLTSGDLAAARAWKGNSVHVSRSLGASVIISGGDETWTVEPADGSTEQRLAEVFDRGLHALHALVAVPDDGTVAIQSSLFPDRFALGPEIQIGADRKILDAARRLAAGDDPVGWLHDELVVTLDHDPDTTLLVASAGGTQRTAPDSFRVFGRTTTADLRRDHEGRLFVERLAQRRGRRPERLFLMGGRFSVVDLEEAQSVELKHELDALLQAQDSYVSLWVEYNEVEQKQVLAAARELGSWRYSECHVAPDGSWSFRLDDAEDARHAQAAKDRGFMVEAAKREPHELSDPTTTTAPDDDAWLDAGGRKPAFVGSPTTIDADVRRIQVDAPGNGSDDEVEPPPQGVLFVSLMGDRVRLQRRRDAVERLTSGTAPMAQLVHLLEGTPLPFARVRKEKALSKRALAFFPHGPNDRQKQALDVAINTPDIALVQGPPGTGKTQTIAALQARLAELAEEGDPLAGQILLTSTQHDAVENAAAKTRIYGLPPVKLGSRSGEKRARLSTLVSHWRHDLQGRIRQTLVERGESQAPLWTTRRAIDRLATRYALAPVGPEQEAALLEEAADLVQPFVPASVDAELRTTARRLRRGGAPTDDRVERAARGLRVDLISFGDDGPRSARRLLRALEGSPLVEDEDLGLLGRAADYVSVEPPPFLGQLERLRDRVLDGLLDQRDDADQRLANADVLGALEKAQGALQEAVASQPEGVADVLHEFLHELEHDPDALRETVSAYAVAYAATCQQADSGIVRGAKGTQGKEGVTFANVVVDEAARSNPLDLFIPMSMAGRRLILVGDQNQLPHMLEPDVERALGDAQGGDEPHELKRSLFERLYAHVLQLESDGIQRCVMLDTQYRMHPVLGDFVGAAFYSAVGGLNSGREPEDFAHDLPGYEGKVAAWVDVPPSEGREKPGQSKSRRSEAKRVATELRRLLDHDVAGRLTFGVITFYSRQEELLWQELAAVGIAEKREGETGYTVRSQYATSEGEDGGLRTRIEVGTVDAFQGKEFDVVFLSAVRSNAAPLTDELSVRRKYGHLTLPNRMCVAMSRQQKLLVVVGDASMVTSDEAAMHVPALHDFHDLCQGEHGVLLS